MNQEQFDSLEGLCLADGENLLDKRHRKPSRNEIVGMVEDFFAGLEQSWDEHRAWEDSADYPGLGALDRSDLDGNPLREREYNTVMVRVRRLPREAQGTSRIPMCPECHGIWRASRLEDRAAVVRLSDEWTTNTGCRATGTTRTKPPGKRAAIAGAIRRGPVHPGRLRLRRHTVDGRGRLHRGRSAADVPQGRPGLGEKRRLGDDRRQGCCPWRRLRARAEGRLCIRSTPFRTRRASGFDGPDQARLRNEFSESGSSKARPMSPGSGSKNQSAWCCGPKG